MPQISQNAQKAKGLMGLVLPLGIAAGVVFGYWVYWRSIADRIESQMQSVVSTPDGSVKVTGFPYRLTLELERPALKMKDGAALSARRLVTTATPINPQLWVLEGVTDPFFTRADGSALGLQVRALQASLRLTPDGLERFSTTFEAIDAREVSRDQPAWGIGQGQVHLVTDPKDPNVIAARFEVSNVKLRAPLAGPGAILGDTINRVMVAGPISQGKQFVRAPNAWAASGGQMTIMAGDIIWGPVSFTGATGALSLNGAGQWQGQIKGTGSLKPEGLAVAGLSAPVDIAIVDGKASLAGLPGLDLSDALQFGQ